MRIINIYLIALLPTLLLTGCFTGIEGTPKITSADVKKEHIHTSAEQTFLKDVTHEPPREWHAGKRFHITDSKIRLVLGTTTPLDTSRLKDSDMVFRGIEKVTSVTGEDMAILRFSLDGGREVTYDANTPYATLMERDALEIPFAVDLDMISGVGEKIKGNTYYITTPIWYDTLTGKTERGLRHVAVEITDVQPGTSVYPIKVMFRVKDSGQEHSVLMTIGNRRTSTRNFDTLFAFDNPREKYPLIEDGTWELIMNSKVKIGMTKDECRLALGAPDTQGQIPTTAGMVEYWSYSEGIYLLFEDGYLSRVR